MIATDRDIANPNLVAVRHQQRRVVRAHVEHDHVFAFSFKLLAGPQADLIEAQEVVHGERRDLHQLDFHLVGDIRLDGRVDAFLLHREEADFRPQHEAAFLDTATERLVIPNHVFQRERNLLLGFVADDLVHSTGFHGGELNESGQRRLTGNADGDQVPFGLVARQKSGDRGLDQLIRHGVGLAEDFRMWDVIERDRDDLTSRFGIAEANRFQTGLADVDAPNGLSIRHGNDPKLLSGWK